MIKKLAISSIVSIALLSQAANAQTKVGNAGVITGTAAVASQYVSKGLDSNRDKPSASLVGEFASNTDIQLILGAGLFYSTQNKPVTIGTGYSYELDYNIGLRKTFDKLTFDLGYQALTYPQTKRHMNVSSDVYYAKAIIAATKDTSLSVYYEQDTTGGYRPGADPNQIRGEYYYELGFSHNFGPASFNASRGDLKDTISFYKLGLSKEFIGLNFTADYIVNDKKRPIPFDNPGDKDDTHIVVGASKSF